MRAVFVDALYWVASINPRDQWHERAVKVEATLTTVRFVTTEAVLIEVLNYLSAYDSMMRLRATRILRLILAAPMSRSSRRPAMHSSPV